MIEETGGIVRKAAPSLDKLAELIKEIGQTPKIDVIIMSPKVWEQVKAAISTLDQGSTPAMLLGAVKVFLHRYLGDLIVYGNSRNKLIAIILSTCEDAV